MKQSFSAGFHIVENEKKKIQIKILIIRVTRKILPLSHSHSLTLSVSLSLSRSLKERPIIIADYLPSLISFNVCKESTKAAKHSQSLQRHKQKTKKQKPKPSACKGNRSFSHTTSQYTERLVYLYPKKKEKKQNLYI